MTHAANTGVPSSQGWPDLHALLWLPDGHDGLASTRLKGDAVCTTRVK
jgi:hypothetical protein